jgi:hypothetical protein
MRLHPLAAPPLLAVAALAVAGVPTQPAVAQILYQAGFEAPQYTAGSPVAGQGGFSGSSDAAFVVTSARANGGTQSLTVATAGLPLTARVYAWPDLSPAFSGSASTPLLVTGVDIFFSAASGGGNGAFSAFGLNAYGLGGAFLAAARLRADGAVQMEDENGTVATSGSATAQANRWNRLELFLNVPAGVATASLNGIDTGLSLPVASGVPVTDVDLYATADGTETAFFDNYLVEARGVTAIPEAGAAHLLAVALPAALAAVGRRRGRCR